MAFLDNSGDILLDAVLTDTGRKRMAKGEFQITKFALGDEEINYELYNMDHPSGSAFFDLEILQTPILEAFTNNRSSMQSKLISLDRNDALFLPILKLNTNSPSVAAIANKISSARNETHFKDGFILVATSALEESNDASLSEEKGVLYGVDPSRAGAIFVDQGLDTGGVISKAHPMESDLIEFQYLVQVDHRLLRVKNPFSNLTTPENYSFVDDDNVATYYFGIKQKMIERIGPITAADENKGEVFNGPQGTRFMFQLISSLNLRESESLFTELGNTWTTTIGNGAANRDLKFIDTIVRVSGLTTGYSLDIPIRIIRS